MRVLVTYASKHGSTRGIAEAIGKRLDERGLPTEVRPIAEVDGLDRYGAVVVGSAVYLGAWRKEATAFLDRHAEELRLLPTWLFSSGPTGEDQTPQALSEKQRRRLDAIGARNHHVFEGALVPERLGLLERRMVKTAKSPVGDFRDWNDIECWADEVADGVLAEPLS